MQDLLDTRQHQRMLYSMRAVKAINGAGAGMLGLFVMVGAMSAFGLAILIAVAVAAVVLLVVLVVRLCQAAPPVPKQYDRVDDAAARAHRARMAAIRDGRTAARFEGQARYSNRR